MTPACQERERPSARLSASRLRCPVFAHACRALAPRSTSFRRNRPYSAGWNQQYKVARKRRETVCVLAGQGRRLANATSLSTREQNWATPTPATQSLHDFRTTRYGVTDFIRSSGSGTDPLF